jgi:sugar (pentulose or hexulose) kinase
MPVRLQAVAVLDVGKTNKKVALYDRDFSVLGEQRTTIQPLDRDGLEVEDTVSLLKWFRSALGHLAREVEVRNVAITAHGATFAMLDADGRLAHPVISYTAERGAEIQDDFYAAYGDRETLHAKTCTPDVGFANVGKQMYFVKTRLPEVWANVRHALFYNSYLGYELTGGMAVEPTYLGNHTYLWNFREKKWSQIGLDLGADRLFPTNFGSPWSCLGPVRREIAAECGLSRNCTVTYGIHDSNANLVPYLAQGHSDFLLNSTGTWCVMMRPSDTLELTPDEIKARVFFNLDVYNRPVRTCIFPAGMEYDTFRGFTSLPDHSNADVVRGVLHDRKLFVIPGVLPSASAFPGATPRVVDGSSVYALEDLRQASNPPLDGLGQPYNAALNIALAIATAKTLTTCGAQPGTTVFIEGGFAKNTAYCQLLAAMCPDQIFLIAKMREGTSLGAAMTGWMLAEGLPLDGVGKQLHAETAEIPPQPFPGLDAYVQAFHEQAQQ